jgi:hypothetical protein
MGTEITPLYLMIGWYATRRARLTPRGNGAEIGPGSRFPSNCVLTCTNAGRLPRLSSPYSGTVVLWVTLSRAGTRSMLS